MPRGRKPDGAELQAAKGNPGRRKPKVPAVAKPGDIVRPKWLAKSRRALEVWQQLVPILQRLNLATELDAQPLARYCRYVVEWVAADEHIRKEGTWYVGTDTNGQPTKRIHPAFKAWHSLEKLLADIEASYGMRADARFKILRDQAAVLGGLPLFDSQGRGGSDAPRVTVPEEEDAIGALARLDGPPPGSRPN
jgi:P27 family predicted phage terminase small subunit